MVLIAFYHIGGEDFDRIEPLKARHER
jgi:hypothetical protein